MPINNGPCKGLGRTRLGAAAPALAKLAGRLYRILAALPPCTPVLSTVVLDCSSL